MRNTLLATLAVLSLATPALAQEATTNGFTASMDCARDTIDCKFSFEVRGTPTYITGQLAQVLGRPVPAETTTFGSYAGPTNPEGTSSISQGNGSYGAFNEPGANKLVEGVPSSSPGATPRVIAGMPGLAVKYPGGVTYYESMTTENWCEFDRAEWSFLRDYSLLSNEKNSSRLVSNAYRGLCDEKKDVEGALASLATLERELWTNLEIYPENEIPLKAILYIRKTNKLANQ